MRRRPAPLAYRFSAHIETFEKFHKPKSESVVFEVGDLGFGPFRSPKVSFSIFLEVKFACFQRAVYLTSIIFIFLHRDDEHVFVCGFLIWVSLGVADYMDAVYDFVVFDVSVSVCCQFEWVSDDHAF